jgi:hypothetical protein
MLEVADVLRAAGAEVCARLAVLPSQQQALRSILQCRTCALGGELYRCGDCGAYRFSYHSCGNRHCPKCHGQQTQQWLEQQRARLLPCSYYLLTFTLPSELRALARSNQKLVYGLLLNAASATIQKLCADPKWLGAQPAIIGVLHTWTRAMLYHPHAHFLVSAGGLSPEGRCWREPKNPKFLLPVHALSKIFRAKMRDGLKEAQLLTKLPQGFWAPTKKWVVHAQPAGTGEKVLDYLARYLFHIAISNSRLERLENGQVTFGYRDNATQQLTQVRLPAAEFVQRFLQHVLPKGFAKVRHYGLDSAACRHRHAQAMGLLAKAPAAAAPCQALAPPPQATGEEAAGCPRCGKGPLIWVGELLACPDGPVLIIPLTRRGRHGPCLYRKIPP